MPITITWKLHCLALLIAFTASPALAQKKPHSISFGKQLPVRWFIGPTEDKGLDLTVRPLIVDGQIREFTIGEPHEVTERIFVVRRAYRLNDELPELDQPVGKRTMPKWKWQRGGWLMVDRQTGRISQVNLPEFDPFYSSGSWYRDYYAYCGLSDDGEKLNAVVMQLGRKKPVLRRALGMTHQGDLPDSECAAPTWQRNPPSVSFQPAGGQRTTYNIRGYAVEIIPEDEPETL